MFHQISQIRTGANLYRQQNSWTGDTSLCALRCKSEVVHHRICVGMAPPCSCWWLLWLGSLSWPVNRNKSCIRYISLWKSIPNSHSLIWFLKIPNQPRSPKNWACQRETTPMNRGSQISVASKAPRRLLKQILGPSNASSSMSPSVLSHPTVDGSLYQPLRHWRG